MDTRCPDCHKDPCWCLYGYDDVVRATERAMAGRYGRPRNTRQDALWLLVMGGLFVAYHYLTM